MKILFIGETANPRCIGGIETFGRTLKKFFKKKLLFLCFSTKKIKYFEMEDIIEINFDNFFIKILNRISKNKIRKSIISKKIEKIAPDICILRAPNNLDYIKKKEIKTLLVQHNCYDDYVPLLMNYIEILKENLDYFIFLSEYDKQKFIKEINFPEEKAKVIRHSCEMEILEKKKKKNRKLIMIARLENKQKRIDLAINAMKNLQDFNLIIYGDGSDKKFLEDLIRKNNLNNVFLYGGTNQVKEVLDNAGIFIMTSDYEGYGITNIEAMRRGLPIILRNTFEAAHDVVINNGILLDKEWNEDKFIEAVKKIYANYDYYSKNSIELGKRHDFEVIKKQWEDLVDSLEDEKNNE